MVDLDAVAEKGKLASSDSKLPLWLRSFGGVAAA